jgi:hypothetical protein
MSWYLNKSQFKIVFVGEGGKSHTKKYTKETFSADFTEFENKLGVNCPTERRNEIEQQIIGVSTTTDTTTQLQVFRTSLYSFPAGTFIPEYLAKCSNAEECSTILRLGVETKLKMDELARDSLLETLCQEKYSEQLIAITNMKKEITDKYATEISKYQAELETVRTQMREQQGYLSNRKDIELEEATRTIKERCRIAEINAEVLKQENAHLQEVARASRITFQDEFSNHMETIQKRLSSNYDGKTSMMESAIADLKQEKKDLTLQLNSLLQVRANSSKLGQQGEANLESLIQNAFPESRIDIIEKHCGDLVQHHKNMKIMWEAKNHHTSVPKRDVDKFLKDMRENTDIDIGVMVAMNAHIEAHNSNHGLDFEFLNDADGRPHRCVFYIGNLLSFDNPIFVLRFMNVFLLNIQRIKMTDDGENKRGTTVLKLQRLASVINGRMKVWKKRKAEIQKEVEENSAFMDTLLSSLGDIVQDMS